MSSDTSKLRSSWNVRTAMSVGLSLLKWAVVLSLSLAGTLIVMASLGVSAQLLGWSIGVAAFGDDVTVKYQILLAWTLGAMIVAFLSKLIVLIKRRNDHDLRWTEYLGHGLTSSVLSGGLAYGAVAVVIAAMRGLVSDIETIGEADHETVANVALLAILPILLAMMAAVMTAHKNIVDIPKSSPPDQTLARMLQPLRVLAIYAMPWAMRVKDHMWSSRGRSRATPGVTVETLGGAAVHTETMQTANHSKGAIVGDQVQHVPITNT